MSTCFFAEKVYNIIMPIPKPSKMEKKSDFLSRCMGDDTMNKEFPKNAQRYAVCQSKWDEKKSKASSVVSIGNEEFIQED